jgi:MoxR-like ATPase
MRNKTLYHGDGKQRPEILEQLAALDLDPDAMHDPRGYLATPELSAAVTTSLMLGMPLLLTGEPGSGKSRLAASVAFELDLPLLEFHVKSDTQARDLLYRFDAIGRFHASQAEKRAADARRFLTFEAIGRALLHAKTPDYSYGTEPDQLGLPQTAVEHPGRRTRSVLLIDEIDKAPRDVPNDLLDEIDRMRFSIPELAGEGEPVPQVALTRAERQYRPIVIITSNSEKALPEPFVRRCVYHHLNLPPFRADPGAEDTAVTIEQIVLGRLGERFGGGGDKLFAQLMDLFRFLRRDVRGLERRPGLAELLTWLTALMPEQRPAGPPPEDLDALDEEDFLHKTRDCLLKNQSDQARATELIRQWREQAA